MFTGLVRERGKLIAAPQPSPQGGVALRLGHSRALGEQLILGASLAVSGVCLTIVDSPAPGESCVELAPETLRRTTLGELAAGAEVNLEPALRLGEPLGGHWVQGHVDTTVAVVARRDFADPLETKHSETKHSEMKHSEMTFALPDAYRGYVVEKGSVCLDGVSLTVAGTTASSFTVALIPHTLEVTTLGRLAPGDRVNLEVDILAKYVHRSLAAAGVIPQ